MIILFLSKALQRLNACVVAIMITVEDTLREFDVPATNCGWNGWGERRICFCGTNSL